MNPKTQESREWRAEQRRLGFIPKLIWVRATDWVKVKALIDKLRDKKQSPL